MVNVNLEVMSYALFMRIPSYLELNTGRAMAGFVIPDNKREDTDLYLLLPNFSYSHVAQIYLRNKYGDSDMLKEHNLDTYPTFPLLLSEEQRELEGEYHQKSHWFITDHDLEDEYGDFSDKYTLECAKTWCIENGIGFYLEAR